MTWKDSTVYKELFRLKILYRNLRAKPQRRAEALSCMEQLKKAGSESRRIYFCGIPVHNNMGDQAQRHCIEKWCGTWYPDYRIVPLSTWAFYEGSFRKALERQVGAEDIFVIQSGYCTTSRHYDHPMHRYIVSRFTKNRILIMPQTVRFVQEKDGRKTGKIYDAHPGLLFLARDRTSFASARHFFPGTKVLLFPDIVTTLIGTRRPSCAREGVLLCIRNDAEKKYGEDQILLLERKFRETGVRCDRTDTNSTLPAGDLQDRFEEELEKLLTRFSSYRVVITDRYHGTIFSMIAKTPVIVLATRDHKVKSGTEWFRGICDRAFRNAGSVGEAFRLAQEVLRQGEFADSAQADAQPAEDRPYFREKYYDHLKEEFEKL